VRARALHGDVIVVTSAVFQLNCVLVRSALVESEGGGPLNVVEVPAGGVAAEAFLIDSPALPEELEALPSLVSQAGFPVPSGLLATHADWDHVLGRLAFPELALGIAESTAERMAAEPGKAQRELRDFDDELYVERPQPLALGALQALPVPGRCELGTRELELHPTGGHTADGMAVVVPWAGVVVLGDYVSPIEIPMIDPGGGIELYEQTLARLRPLIATAEHVVPGHGPVMDSARAEAVLEEDLAYLQALLRDGAAAHLPEGRRSGEQKKIHARNAELWASGSTRRS
jgi:glyoxylase-like metal-dependent hydrolase (beta-lactamase superfamily II)